MGRTHNLYKKESVERDIRPNQIKQRARHTQPETIIQWTYNLRVMHLGTRNQGQTPRTAYQTKDGNQKDTIGTDI